MVDLPEPYIEKMKSLLQEEFPDFIKSYTEKHSLGLRINTLKVSVKEFLEQNPFSLTQIPWSNTGFYYNENEQPGKHPYHEAGLYYIQEPSAMAVVELLDPRPGEKILDLCAAPGGKTTHIATKMKQEGFIIANEIHPTRVKALSQNIERMGIKNAVVTNEKPERLAERFEAFFDRVLVDAPCSGEGMFRKDPMVCSEWSLQNVESCANRQLKILEQAARMVRAGGRLVYSTCTFSPEENEGVIHQLLKAYPSFEIEKVERYAGFQNGRSDWIDGHDTSLEQMIRIWPHHVEGEGHFIAILRKKNGETKPFNSLRQVKRLQDKKKLAHYELFAKEHLHAIPNEHLALFGDQLYVLPDSRLSLTGLKVIRAGWHLGTFKKNRFEPSHALALSLHREEVSKTVNFNSKEIIAYLHGESLHLEGSKGWYLITVDGYSIGWGKLVDNVLKNHYPKGLRWMHR